VEIGKVYGRLPISVGFVDPNHYAYYEQILALWNDIGNQSKVLKDDRLKLESQYAELTRVGGQIAARNGAQRVQQTAYNNQVKAYQAAQSAFNAKAKRVNAIQQVLKCQYLTNRFAKASYYCSLGQAEAFEQQDSGRKAPAEIWTKPREEKKQNRVEWRRLAQADAIVKAFPLKPTSDDLLDLYEINKNLKSPSWPICWPRGAKLRAKDGKKIQSSHTSPSLE